MNVGLPREVEWHGIHVHTGIFKEPVEGRVALRTLNLDGDRQADLSVHGGQFKAVYCYQLTHYDYWKKELPGRELTVGMFGENFTLDSFMEESIFLGDRYPWVRRRWWWRSLGSLATNSAYDLKTTTW